MDIFCRHTNLGFTDMEKKCPNCNNTLPIQKTAYWPFCSTRCKMIDLGKWMNEEYRVPIESKNSELTSSVLEEDNED